MIINRSYILTNFQAFLRPCLWLVSFVCFSLTETEWQITISYCQLHAACMQLEWSEDIDRMWYFATKQRKKAKGQEISKENCDDCNSLKKRRKRLFLPFSRERHFRLAHVLWYDILERYYNILGWKSIVIFNWKEKTYFWPISSMFTWFSSQNMVTSFQNNFPNYRSKGDEQVFYYTN